MSTPIEEQTFRVRDSKIWYLEERFARIAKRAKRIGCPAPRFEIIATEDVPVKADKTRVGYHGWDTTAQEETGEIVRWHTMRLIGERPIIAGHKFIGTLEHNSELGVIIRAVPGETMPIQYREADPTNCDHCRIKIKTRKETFVVEHVATEVFKQVGRQCVADFLGGVDPKSVLALVECLSEAGDLMSAAEGDLDDERWGGGEGRGAHLFDSIHVPEGSSR